ncbi:hypothetical protein PRUB_a4409 [Pseudoalteromonas rubra]|uniref:Class I lanthipeptide n=1 Tax=Pseudoalteromonas rubra TaxID=43658 RepID=A0A8T0C9E5_9GAMM|nr:hypothetical protein [Pseudoalteromonas rubra]KAF7787230.1 hypothetical protein PRUB_a4409 [Pseudoalteromonas rubra]
MKSLKVKKTKLKTLVNQQKSLPNDATPQVGGGITPVTITITISIQYCTER